MERKVKQYGWVPDLPDARDHMYAAPQPVLTKLPPKFDLRPHCPPVIDQGALGSCTANAIANAHLFDQRKQKVAQPFLPSRLFVYYNERVMEGTVNSDSGAMIRDGIKSVANQGACPEKLWSYQINKFTKKPSSACYKEALKHQALSYSRVTQSRAQMKGCLAS